MAAKNEELMNLRKLEEECAAIKADNLLKEL
jgi:hypothetical protein